MTHSRIVDSTQEKMQMYKGEFPEYARPYDRYLEESRFKEVEQKASDASEISKRKNEW